MTEAVEAARKNRRGQFCPPWCQTDHDRMLIPASAEHPAIYSDAHCGPQRGEGRATVRALMKADDEVIVYAACGAGTAEAYIGYRNKDAVEDLAKFVENLADLSPGLHLELAAAIRQAGQDAES